MYVRVVYIIYIKTKTIYTYIYIIIIYNNNNNNINIYIYIYTYVDKCTVDVCKSNIHESCSITFLVHPHGQYQQEACR